MSVLSTTGAVPGQQKPFARRLTPEVRWRLGICLMLLSFGCRGAAAYLLVRWWGQASIAVFAAGLYAAGKGIFYLGLGLAGPAAVQRYAWLRPSHWLRRWRLSG